MNPQAILNRSFTLSNGNVDGMMTNTSGMVSNQTPTTITPGSIINSVPHPMNGGDPTMDSLYDLGLGAAFDLPLFFPDTVMSSDFEQVYDSFIDDREIGAGTNDYMNRE
jgi:hypothetical protein